jgi:hypothetical protein
MLLGFAFRMSKIWLLLSKKFLYKFMNHETNNSFDQEKLFNSIKMPMECFQQQYELGQKILQKVDGLPTGVIDEKFRVLIEVHQQIMENLNCIGMLVVDMYKNQAGILASTIFELAHMGTYVFNNESALKQWIEMRGDFSKEFKIPGGIEAIVRDNIIRSCQTYDRAEYEVYKQFCRFKHPHPIFFGLKSDGVFTVGNEVNETTIQHCWYILHRVARYSNYTTQDMMKNYPQFFDQKIFDHHNKFSNSLKRVNDHILKNFPTWMNNPLKRHRSE